MIPSPPPKTPFHPAALRCAAETFGTPTYVYAQSVIEAKIRELRQALDGIPLRLLYAMKSNSSPAVLRIMCKAGLGIDAVSPGELQLALGTGFDAEDVLFSANNMTDDEMREAAGAGVLLNIGELSRLDKFGRLAPGSEICIRLNPQVGAGHHEHVITAGERSKFGIPVEDVEAIHKTSNRHGLKIVGLHQHIGSGIMSADTLWRAMKVLLDAAGAFPNVRFLNFGGGLGVAYRPDEPSLDLDNFGRRIVDPLRTFASARATDELSYCFEPGRYLTAEAGVLLVRVNTIKRNRGRLFAGTDSGMGHLVRPAIYGSYHAVYNLSNPEGEPETYDVTGNICEAGDLFARDRPVQQIREGDVLAILDAGAYGMAMASTYNMRPLPAEVLITAEGELELVRRRLTASELVERYLELSFTATGPSAP